MTNTERRIDARGEANPRLFEEMFFLSVFDFVMLRTFPETGSALLVAASTRLVQSQVHFFENNSKIPIPNGRSEKSWFKLQQRRQACFDHHAGLENWRF